MMNTRRKLGPLGDASEHDDEEKQVALALRRKNQFVRRRRRQESVRQHIVMSHDTDSDAMVILCVTIIDINVLIIVPHVVCVRVYLSVA
jgi:hypothetical protein